MNKFQTGKGINQVLFNKLIHIRNAGHIDLFIHNKQLFHIKNHQPALFFVNGNAAFFAGIHQLFYITHFLLPPPAPVCGSAPDK
ncbi:hypothetical protein SDC9_208442 [bioreactor metagenome]|uniref:Uncharacterized protein n=1 Tax=bioreactor metagenome TaxID=1076179 RepID=A0A645JAT0_9ZZZZ